jgi:hypothetical protein
MRNELTRIGRPHPLRSPPRRTSGHDGVLIVADGAQRAALAELAGARGHAVYVASTPLDAVHALERHRGRVRYAIISSAVSWEPELRALIADDFPGVEAIVLAA